MSQASDEPLDAEQPEEIDIYSLDDFTTGYIECMLWSSTDNSDESGGKPLDDNYDISDIAMESLREIVADCKDFQEANSEQLQELLDDYAYTLERAGHDFWLTRNRHGAGFWDRGFGKVGDALTEASHAYGGCDPIVGDDGKVYVS